MVHLHYSPLGSTPDLPVDEDFRLPVPKPSLDDYVFTATYLAVILSTAASLFLAITTFLSLCYKPAEPFPSKSPTTYINLDRANLNHTLPFPPIFSYAHVVLQIDTADPSRHTTEEDRPYRSHNGIIYPDDRHIVISPRVSTIIQFRHLDYGMEKCVLHAVVPQASMKHDPKTQFHELSVIKIWRLTTNNEISRYISNTWYNAAPRLEMFVSLTFERVGEELRSQEFRCLSGEYSTFELACSNNQKECLLDFWQVKGEPHNGFFLSQADSLISRDKHALH